MLLTSCNLTDLSQVTVTSIDGVGAYDLISRNAMLEGLLRMEGGDQTLPFVRMFYSAPSGRYGSHNKHIAQGEGGEQSDPLMPMLFALGQHKSLVEAHVRLSDNEHLFAFLDDVYITNQRAGSLKLTLLWKRSSGPTQASVSTMEKPKCGTVVAWSLNIEELTRIARQVRPDAVVWRGDHNLPLSEQGLKVLGVPIGHPEFVKEFLQGRSK